MHLLAAQPGGFIDEAGIVDLAQTPAALVILAASDSLLAALAAAVETLPQDFPEVRLANWMQLLQPAAFDLYCHKVLDYTQVVVVSLLGGKNYWAYGFEQLQQWAKTSNHCESNQRQLIIVPGDDSMDAELFRATTVSLSDAELVWRYLRSCNPFNSQQLFYFLGKRYFNLTYHWQRPEPLPNCLLYRPGQEGKNFSLSLTDWQQQNHDKITANYPVCLVLFYRSHLQSANTQMFDDLIHCLEDLDLLPLALAITSLKDSISLQYINRYLDQINVKLILNTTGFSSQSIVETNDIGVDNHFISPFNSNIPVLQLVLAGSTERDWQNSGLGLRSRDRAMQIVLPELDGRIITRAIGFKTANVYNKRCQLEVIRYALNHERAHWVAKLAKAYIQLAQKTNQAKRLALVLANYPTKEGRMGNGVGLDTPASTINILCALQAAGYSIQSIPDHGDALIALLQQQITNDTQTLLHRPCQQSMAVTEYEYYFKQLPESCQQAVLEQWGSPKQDPKYRHGRIMVAGIRLGEIYISVQPARGFERDLTANYHSPDLVPPHSYLAFYFWLRHSFKVDAVVHVGKHGNLEWLPGKSLTLSNTCWPEIALGPVPHFYPFIVNDPGEGTQAKRRTQAVIIDHLMPPLTRAETYGELQTLEALLDEYYQALGLDQRREEWLRQQIIQQLCQSELIHELPEIDGNFHLEQFADEVVTQDVLSQLDTYLCEIKETQIRHGLHILGELPNQEKLMDTIVALLRLPRGKQPEQQGILHSLVTDFKLKNLYSESLFDPFEVAHDIWQGEQPILLVKISSQVWRTDADTRERLELLARDWVQRFVIANEDLSLIEVDFPATYVLLKFANNILLPLLVTSVKQEIDALIAGLSGEFVVPGPSGAPSRGRLDTLPTGRNFYSIDHRAIPTPAAWALGQRSAQALLERHLQEHGEYPKQLGLSVWGTATMRTGGDDIAQAFALMGVRPLWTVGSQQVTDIEIISTMLLGRPRIDVTLRVSGFFRDAFPNVMRLFDHAVQVLANLEEPGDGNVIRNHIANRQQQLIRQGMAEQQAWQQASYRVFGSKPGAYGAGLQGLIDERCWQDSKDLAQAYLNWGGYAYSEQEPEGVPARSAFKHQLGQLEVVVHNQDNREHDLLDSDDYYQFQGGMSNAIKEFSGTRPVIYHNDHSNPERPKIKTLKEELNQVLRARVLNPKWIRAIQGHGYKGAFEMAATVDYLFAYDATTHLVADYQYQQISDAFIFEQQNQTFLRQHNMAALEEMTERLLEAIQRGLWQAPQSYQDALQQLLLELDEQREIVEST